MSAQQFESVCIRQNLYQDDTEEFREYRKIIHFPSKILLQGQFANLKSNLKSLLMRIQKNVAENDMQYIATIVLKVAFISNNFALEYCRKQHPT